MLISATKYYCASAALSLGILRLASRSPKNVTITTAADILVLNSAIRNLEFRAVCGCIPSKGVYCRKSNQTQVVGMEKRVLLNSIVDAFLVWWLRSGRYSWSKLRRALFERRYLKVALCRVHSVEDIETCLKQVTWTMDGPLHLFDSISYPQTVWATKKDDCDGFAILAAELLQQWQAETKPVLITVMLRPMRSSHTVCGFYAPDRSLCYFDNGSLRRGDFKSYGDIVALVQGSSRLVCWDVRNPATFELNEFHRG